MGVRKQGKFDRKQRLDDQKNGKAQQWKQPRIVIGKMNSEEAQIVNLEEVISSYYQNNMAIKK